MTRKLIRTGCLALSLALAACQPATTASDTPTLAAPTTSPATPTPAATPTGTWIRLAPDSGPPGTVIRIDGYLPGGPDAASAAGDPTLLHTTLCWDGCLTGFTAVDTPVEWSTDQPGQFSAQFTAPSLPWLGPDGPVPGATGDYRVGVQCLGPLVAGCALQEAQAEAVFHLTGSSPSRCLAGQPCVELALTPAQAQPGDTVTVSGWAPVFETIDGQPFGYSLSLQTTEPQPQSMPVGQITQALDGSLSGGFVVPQSLPGAGLLASGTYAIVLEAFTPHSLAAGAGPSGLAQAALTLGQGLAWASIQPGTPAWVSASADLNESRMYVDPQDPAHMAYCAPYAVRVSHDSGKTWSGFPIDGAVQAIAGIGFEVLSGGATGGQPGCLEVSLDSLHPNSLFAVFGTADVQMGAPPEFFLGLASTDSGQTWSLIPGPGPDVDFPFGGLTVVAPGTVAALFASAGNPATPLVAQVTQDGGRTWWKGQFGCPGGGPCLRWGPAPGSIGGMGAPRPQTLLTSMDSGQTWSQTEISIDLHTFVAGQAAGFQAGQVLVVSGLDSFPARWSEDRGQTWQALSLPPLPDNDPSSSNYTALQILPGGSLVAVGDDGGWDALMPGASSWCQLRAADLPGQAVWLAPAEGNIWWLNPATGQPQSTELSHFTCPP